MIINQSKLLLGSVSALVLVLSCSLPASAKLSANKLSLNSLSDKAKFDTKSVTVSKITPPDGTVLRVR